MLPHEIPTVCQRVECGVYNQEDMTDFFEDQSPGCPFLQVRRRGNFVSGQNNLNKVRNGY